ncbi:class I SAM-dependent methyltransferase [Trebonia kvetii]|uniref:Class I SAM-dependent methyltransferase n=1 Tax=Trebonia kvetii TaxID=2480626 RepID=A0A6P2C4R5_9ACTN|nr:class I SAM-dependent methyltransferase [Trebonia kvetii]TVZ06422.1 class I SAM-dependent methyltransferase [Trebonia kvetii]
MGRLIRMFVNAGTVAVAVMLWLAGALALGLVTDSGATATTALMALGLLAGGVLLLIRHSLELAARIGNLGTESQRSLATMRRIESRLGTELRQTFRQIEAIQNLNAILPASDVLPATRGWAASPDLILVLIDQVIAQRPSLIVECGSGASTLWLALALRRFGIDGRIVALEADPVFADKTRGFLARHGVSDVAEVREAPLEDLKLADGSYTWYARWAWKDLAGIDLLFVDGPPAATCAKARYPALPSLREALNPASIVIVDDLVVPDMQETLRLWLDAYPEFSSEILPLEKQAALLRTGPR